MENQSEQNIIIKEASESSITLEVNGDLQKIDRKVDKLITLLNEQQSKTFQTADKIYNIESITNANFDYVVGQSVHKKNLPQDLAENLITEENVWVNSLKQVLQRIVAVGSKPASIFRHYGWLIEAFLQKMETPAGRERKLRRLSFMSEAFQSSLRYLCIIQMAQILKLPEKPKNPLPSEFLNLKEKDHLHYDYLNLLIVTTDILRDQQPFVPDITDFVSELTDTKSDLYGIALFLEKQRNNLLDNAITEGPHLDRLLDEYLTALVFWLSKIYFIGKYHLVSIKDINLKYRLGTPKRFVHHYGELHGIYTTEENFDYPNYAIEEFFTYNQSVLLFNGNDVKTCLDNIADDSTYISLSPLIIDQSVFTEKETQTPEIYYYSGYSSGTYHFANHKNELPFGERQEIPSNKKLRIKTININQPKFDELFAQLEEVFKPFKVLSQ